MPHYIKPWLDHSRLPAIKADEPGDDLSAALRKRYALVEWLNMEIKKANIEMRRGHPPDRFLMLKKFAMSIRTSMFKQQSRWWNEREKVDFEDCYCEYVARRMERAKDKATR